MLLCLKMDKVKIHFTRSLQVRYPTEHGLPVKSGRSAEKSCPFGKVNGHGRFLPSTRAPEEPLPQHSNQLELEMPFLPIHSDRWAQQHSRWVEVEACPQHPASLHRGNLERLLLGGVQCCGKHRASRAKNRYLQNPLHSEPSSVCCPATASACLHGCSRDMKLFVNFSHMESMIQNVKLKIWLQTPENVNVAKFGCHITHKRRPKSTTCY